MSAALEFYEQSRCTEEEKKTPSTLFRIIGRSTPRDESVLYALPWDRAMNLHPDGMCTVSEAGLDYESRVSIPPPVTCKLVGCATSGIKIHASSGKAYRSN